MTIPGYDETLLHPLSDDDAVLERVSALIGSAYRRQIWMLLLDERDVQLPQLLPMDVPRRARRGELEGYAAFLETVTRLAGAASVVAVLERPGEETYSDADRSWFRFVTDAACRAGVRLRGPILSHRGGVRWVAAEDYAL